jgi:hypothetical protein
METVAPHSRRRKIFLMAANQFQFKSREELTAMSFQQRIEYFQRLIEALKRKEEELDAVINEAEKLKHAIRKEHD